MLAPPKTPLSILWRFSSLIGVLLAVGATASPARTQEQADPNEFYPARTEWAPIDSTSPNVSHFTYRDLNRNGHYDVGDRPMIEVAVTMSGPNGAQAVRRSNIHGFANFTNSPTASPVDVSEPGTYEFVVQVPPGWELTSGNGTQTLTYTLTPETRNGIVADHVPVPAGLAPILTIDGRIAERNAEGDLVGMSAIDLIATSPAGEAASVLLDADGNFSIPAEAGDWALEVQATDSIEVLARTVTVGNTPVRMSAIVIGETPPSPAGHEVVVDFETVTRSEITKMPNGTGGLNWDALLAVDNEFYGGEGYINATMSGHYVAYNTSGYPVTIERDDGFDFRGGYFAVAWRSAEGETLQIRAWRGDELLGSETLLLSAMGPFWFDADYRDITRLEIATDHYWQFVADDLTFGL
ncbi:MAG: hypothetical protein WD711_12675, partial [Dongiaceae bacterium]